VSSSKVLISSKSCVHALRYTCFQWLKRYRQFSPYPNTISCDISIICPYSDLHRRKDRGGPSSCLAPLERQNLTKLGHRSLKLYKTSSRAKRLILIWNDSQFKATHSTVSKQLTGFGFCRARACVIFESVHSCFLRHVNPLY
jgi:hypothetical protein